MPRVACAWYEKKTGAKAPVKDKNATIPKDLEDMARRELAENLGHSRPSITGCYIGSRNIGSGKDTAKPTDAVPTITKLATDALWTLLLIGRG